MAYRTAGDEHTELVDWGSVPESYRTSGTEIGAYCQGSQVGSNQDADVTLKEEVGGSPESTQQLYPEILNCAAIVASHKDTHTPGSASNGGIHVENGEKCDNLDSAEGCTNQPPQIMAEDAIPVSEKADMKNSSESCTRDSCQPTDGDGHEKISDSPCENKPEVVVAPSSNKSGEENEGAEASSPSLPQNPEAITSEVVSQGVQDGVGTIQTSETPDVKNAQVPTSTGTLGKSAEIGEDIYRDEKEIEEEKKKKGTHVCEKSSNDDPKLGVGPEVNILEYCTREWKGKTSVAKQMKLGYEKVSDCFDHIRQVRGDNYCALRATLFQCLSQTTELPHWLDNTSLIQLPEQFSRTYDWIKLWRFWTSDSKTPSWSRIKECLEVLKKKWAEMSQMKIYKQKACDEIFQTEEEYYLYEAVKFLMLKTAVDLYNANKNGKEVPMFSWLLFARNTSKNPCEFMKNHLNQVGHSGGLEQVEMFLLGYALKHTIKVYRLYKHGTDEFETQYPDDQADWPVVTLITEDDRHYNVPVSAYFRTQL
ncbi:ubiquitin thioesterase otulin [Mantella aurantiaca]